jgi:DNA-binding PadR family transcriptional regulator
MAKLTELEGTVLGVIWEDGPVTTYAIRSTFSSSRSSHFSGSAGAIYPLVERLKELGLVHATRHKQGSRESRRFTITSTGKQALRQWLSRDKSEMAAVEFDPIRARVHFLGILTQRQRERFIQESMVSLQREIKETESLIESKRQAGDKWSVWGTTGALRTLQARLAWLRDILKSQ